MSYTGIPYGPYGLYANTTEFEWGPKPFTGSLDNSSFPNALPKRIAAARQQGHRLVLAMTAVPSEVKTNGKFDLGKWKAKMNTLNTSTIRQAVADGVADGTIVGNKMIDEPESTQWGGVLTKPMIDQMATYARNIFPTLPMGINHGAPGFKWRSGERYRVLDWVSVQYVWNYNQGGITAWRGRGARLRPGQRCDSDVQPSHPERRGPGQIGRLGMPPARGARAPKRPTAPLTRTRVELP